MPHTRRHTRAAPRLLQDTGSAAASVIGARLLAFSGPAGAHSAWHRDEALRMSTEKLQAGGAGMLAAWIELALLPGRLLQVTARPAAWTPTGCIAAWMDAADLWVGVGSAALRPARTAAVRNRARLARRR